MSEQISNIIEEKLKEIKPTLEELYDNHSKEKIEKLIKNQNVNVKEKEKKEKLLQWLEKLKEYGLNIDYNEKMSIEELEKIIQEAKF